MVSETPSTHVFISNSCQPTNPRTFNCAVKKEVSSVSWFERRICVSALFLSYACMHTNACSLPDS